jgi:hypothetical protein
MATKGDLEFAGPRAVYRPRGSVSFDEAVSLVRDAIQIACDNGVSSFLCNIVELTGFKSPDTFQRYFAAVEFAASAAGFVRMAMVARPEIIDPHKFGVTVAGNRGLVSNIFTSEDEAIAWLNGLPHKAPFPSRG